MTANWSVLCVYGAIVIACEKLSQSATFTHTEIALNGIQNSILYRLKMTSEFWKILESDLSCEIPNHIKNAFE